MFERFRGWRFPAGVLPLILLSLMVLAGFMAFTPLAHAQDELATEEDGEGMTLMNILIEGGPVMAALGVLSLILVFLIVFYFMSLRTGRLVSKPLLRKVYSLLSDNNPSDAAQLCEKSDGALPKILAAGLKHTGHGRPTIVESMEAVGSRESEALRHRVSYLASVASVAPMLGLLGTIVGMIRTFNQVAFDPQRVKPIELAGGIAQALGTTAVGLVLSIIATVFFFYFRGRANAIITLMEEISVEFADKIAAIGSDRPRHVPGGLR